MKKITALVVVLILVLTVVGCGKKNPASPTVDPTATATPVSSGPVITLLGANPMNVPLFSAFDDPGAIGIYVNAGVNTLAMITTGAGPNTAVAGQYTMLYTATDNVGNTSTATRIVNVVTQKIHFTIATAGNSNITVNGVVHSTPYDSGLIDAPVVLNVIAGEDITFAAYKEGETDPFDQFTGQADQIFPKVLNPYQ